MLSASSGTLTAAPNVPLTLTCSPVLLPFSRNSNSSFHVRSFSVSVSPTTVHLLVFVPSRTFTHRATRIVNRHYSCRPARREPPKTRHGGHRSPDG